MPKVKDLTFKQKQFCEQYVVSGNAYKTFELLEMETIKKSNGGYYVYALINSIDSKIFYIGKGTKNRMYAHVRGANKEKCNNIKSSKIKSIIKNGGFVDEVILFDNLEEDFAFRLESMYITSIDGLTNILQGVYGKAENLRQKCVNTLNGMIKPCEALLKKDFRAEWGISGKEYMDYYVQSVKELKKLVYDDEYFEFYMNTKGN